MKISTKGRYALRLMIDLAVHRNDGFISLKDIAERQGISKKYLEQIVPLLNRSGFLKTIRGYQGGYKLSKTPEEYTVADILKVTEGNLAPIACLDPNADKCSRCNQCPTLEMWQGLYDVIINYLDSITLQSLLDSDRMKNLTDEIDLKCDDLSCRNRR